MFSKSPPLRARHVSPSLEEDDVVPTYQSSPHHPSEQKTMYEKSRSKARSRSGLIILLIAFGCIAVAAFYLATSRKQLSNAVASVGESSIDAWKSVQNSFGSSETPSDEEDDPSEGSSDQIPWFVRSKGGKPRNHAKRRW